MSRKVRKGGNNKGRMEGSEWAHSRRESFWNHSSIVTRFVFLLYCNLRVGTMILAGTVANSDPRTQGS